MPSARRETGGSVRMGRTDRINTLFGRPAGMPTDASRAGGGAVEDSSASDKAGRRPPERCYRAAPATCGGGRRLPVRAPPDLHGAQEHNGRLFSRSYRK
ncbi:hypothetical protein GCM10009544_38580 [Streptomyces stramineus]|uniref:Uncharacterized protein n=1 Tax=Streptomyces stramineus TaxID=173861 RepID=A0ABP3K6T3_9ACTN